MMQPPGLVLRNNYPAQAPFSNNGLRIASPAISANAIQINRTQPSPGTQKRPPHLRLNNL